MSSLDDIAKDCGTIEYDQQQDPHGHDRVVDEEIDTSTDEELTDCDTWDPQA